MPTELPPDYKPQPHKPGATGKPDDKGEDLKDGGAPGINGGLPGRDSDVVDPTGWKPEGATDKDPSGVPSPAGTPIF